MQNKEQMEEPKDAVLMQMTLVAEERKKCCKEILFRSLIVSL